MCTVSGTLQITDLIDEQMFQLSLNNFELTGQMDIQFDERTVCGRDTIDWDKCAPWYENEGDLEIWWYFYVEWVAEKWKKKEIFLESHSERCSWSTLVKVSESFLFVVLRVELALAH